MNKGGELPSFVQGRMVMFALAFILVAPLPSAPAPHPAEFEAKCIDGSVFKLRVLDEKVGLVTKYGPIQVPFADIKRIEFSMRVPADVEAKINLAIARLNHDDFAIRDAATDELKGYKERAHRLVLKAAKDSDPEINRRANEIIRAVRAEAWPVNDIIITDDSKLVGKLMVESLKVNTVVFGDQSLWFTEVKQLSSNQASVVTPVAAPATLSEYAGQFGKEFAFSVVGAQSGSVWGSGPYTIDSSMGVAAVHAGLVASGQSAVVYVRIVASPAQFMGSVQNGVTSSQYGAYPAGAYEFIRK